MSEKTGCPIVPMALTNTSAIFEDHFPKVKKTTVIIEYSEPIYIDKLEKEQRKFVGAYVRGIIEKTYLENQKLIG